jgi:hypothetical protein
MPLDGLKKGLNTKLVLVLLVRIKLVFRFSKVIQLVLRHFPCKNYSYLLQLMSHLPQVKKSQLLQSYCVVCTISMLSLLNHQNIAKSVLHLVP